MAAFL
ncbi:hypothetical protein YPPY60_1877, partial [Yersinia pestis PY-60]